jgi:hypothetical protein
MIHTCGMTVITGSGGREPYEKSGGTQQALICKEPVFHSQATAAQLLTIQQHPLELKLKHVFVHKPSLQRPSLSTWTRYMLLCKQMQY